MKDSISGYRHFGIRILKVSDSSPDYGNPALRLSQVLNKIVFQNDFVFIFFCKNRSDVPWSRDEIKLKKRKLEVLLGNHRKVMISLKLYMAPYSDCCRESLRQHILNMSSFLSKFIPGNKIETAVTFKVFVF